MNNAVAYYQRLLDDHIKSKHSKFAAILIRGPRASGKTESIKRYAKRSLNLDVPATRQLFEDDPDAALQNFQKDEPLFIDEWQYVPDIMGALKRAVDKDRTPGRFLVAGSVNARSGIGTGRVQTLNMYPMTVAERKQRIHEIPFLDRLLELDEGETLPPAQDTPDQFGYLELALESGYPEAALFQNEYSDRMEFLKDYIDASLTEDATLNSSKTRYETSKLKDYFQKASLLTAETTSLGKLANQAEISRPAATDYDDVLENLFLMDKIPAWKNSSLQRLLKSPKRYLIEPAFLGAMSGRQLNDIAESDLKGRLIDTFIVAQLRSELSISKCNPSLYHFQQEKQNEKQKEVDLIVETNQGLVAIEMKSKAAPEKQDARHIQYLRDNLGDKFHTGVVFHTGEYSRVLDDKILALPISVFWR